MPMSQDETKYQEGDAPGPADAPADAIISDDTRRDNRVPPGQTRTRKWPVLHYGRVPTVPLDKWRLFVRGLVGKELTFTWDEYKSLPRVRVFADFHCVTRWSRLGNVWEGVPVKEIMDRAGVLPTAKFVIAQGYDDGWTTNMPLHEFAAADALIADLHDGEPLSEDHGGPARLIVPKLYAWKSAKWLRALEFLPKDQPGFWERNGYHMYGDPWKEQRHSWDTHDWP